MNTMADEDYFVHELYFQDPYEDEFDPISSDVQDQAEVVPYKLPVFQNHSVDKIRQEVYETRLFLEQQGQLVTLKTMAAALFAAHGHLLKVRHTPPATTMQQRMSRPGNNFLVYRGAVAGDQEIIIDVNFKDRFSLSRSTPKYDQLLAILPQDFVGGLDLLLDTLFTICDAIEDVFSYHSMLPVPPWRKYKNLALLWDSPRRQQDFSIDTLGVLSPTFSSFEAAVKLANMRHLGTGEYTSYNSSTSNAASQPMYCNGYSGGYNCHSSSDSNVLDDYQIPSYDFAPQPERVVMGFDLPGAGSDTAQDIHDTVLSTTSSKLKFKKSILQPDYPTAGELSESKKPGLAVCKKEYSVSAFNKYLDGLLGPVHKVKRG